MRRTTIPFRSTPVGDAVYNASRQVWLASLGAAVVAREWAAQGDARKMFRNLVREGTAVESRTFRVVGERLEGSYVKANTLWRQARHTVSARVKQAADTTVTLVRHSIPMSLPKVTLPAMLMPTKAPAKKRAAPAKRGSKARTAKVVKRGTRARKAATK